MREDEFAGDIMDVDLSGSSVNVGKRDDKDQIHKDAKEIPNPKDLIPAAPLKQFRVSYIVNEMEPYEGEVHIQVRTNDTLKSEAAQREVIKQIFPNYRSMPHMIKINYVQEEDIDVEKKVG